ncbi:cytochrome P450 2K1-like isoform X2 [Ahaetulla prasina]|uniref:cytochrome P450 2K1-like isoform X2 n=1 Tax=Ahaetulla prasina TaxID=499056 RepID=UPI002649382B|nr:cytochrome P450 2K1-like isoform X2 [Ahaetulla prasina]
MAWIGLVLLLLLFILTVLFLFKMGSSQSNSSQKLPPGPRTIPVLGNLHIMDFKRPFKTMIKLSKEYGPVFRLQMGCLEMVVLTGYETVKEALVNQAEAFAERAIAPISEDYAKGFGIIFAHGENWKQMRKFSISALQDYGMGKGIIEDKISEECSILIKTYETYEGKPFDPATILKAAAANIIVSFLLGKRFEYEDATLLRLLELVEENLHLAGTPAVLATFLENLKEFDENNQRTFIDAFLVRQKKENKMSTNSYFHNDNLIGLVDNLFIAGMDTTSNTLYWTLLLMMKYPEVQRKVQEEIAKEVGVRQPRTEDRFKMPYTNAVIHEIQRFADIIPTNLPHATSKDITFKGFFIPKGMHIIPLLTTVLHDESQWEKPHEFYPEHFLDSEGKFVKRDAFMPFSAGQRVCAGKTLARMELFLFFTNLLQRFTFQPPSGTSKDDLDLTPGLGLTTPPMPYKTCAVLS